jgi:bifunctional non-homologous end joining protein LigD
VTNLDKVLYPEAGFTKGGVVDYYARIAPAILPHLADRALTVTRWPDGVEGKHFFEKRCPSHRPDWVRSEAVWAGSRAGEIEFCVCDDRPTLIWLAQLAALELHPSLSLAADVETPTVLAFDLDPGEPATIVECCRVALLIRELFTGLGLRCFPKTSGSKGMQVYVPLNSPIAYATTKPFARAVAQALERQEPDLVVSRMTKDLREGKVFVDWSQNTASKTTIAAYSLRARSRPTASTPLRWDEVESARDPLDLSFEAAEVVARFEADGDLFAPVLEIEQALPDGLSGA